MLSNVSGNKNIACILYFVPLHQIIKIETNVSRELKQFLFTLITRIKVKTHIENEWKCLTMLLQKCYAHFYFVQMQKLLEIEKTLPEKFNYLGFMIIKWIKFKTHIKNYLQFFSALQDTKMWWVFLFCLALPAY